MKFYTDWKIDGEPCILSCEVVPGMRGARDTFSRDRRNGRQLEPDEPEHILVTQVFNNKGLPAPHLANKLHQNEGLREDFVESLARALDAPIRIEV
jgi:hypothetical protein